MDVEKLSDQRARRPLNLQQSFLQRKVPQKNGKVPEEMRDDSGEDDFAQDQLFRRLNQSGNEEAWRELFEISTPLIFKVCRQRGLGVADAHDIVQETMVVIVRDLSKLESVAEPFRFQSWVRKIALNKINDHYRRRAVATRLDERSLEWSSPQLHPNEEEEWHWEILHRVINAVRRKVSESDFAIFNLSVIEGHGSQEAARLLNKTVGAVYSAVKRVTLLARNEAAKLRVNASGECHSS